jgi:hypothetical protein
MITITNASNMQKNTRGGTATPIKKKITSLIKSQSIGTMNIKRRRMQKILIIVIIVV